MKLPQTSIDHSTLDSVFKAMHYHCASTTGTGPQLSTGCSHCGISLRTLSLCKTVGILTSILPEIVFWELFIKKVMLLMSTITD